MARQESDREDLLREATALVERIELVPRTIEQSNSAHIVAGFRSDCSLSIFFGEDPVYQFNAAGELRRAYCDGKLLKAERGQLVSLERVRTEQQVQLVRQQLGESEKAAFLARMTDDIRKLAESLNANASDIVRQVPPTADVVGRLRLWLASHDDWPIAARPNV